MTWIERKRVPGAFSHCRKRVGSACEFVTITVAVILRSLIVSGAKRRSESNLREFDGHFVGVSLGAFVDVGGFPISPWIERESSPRSIFEVQETSEF